MPQRPPGLIRRKVKNKRGATVVYYMRRKIDGKDQKASLGLSAGKMFGKARTLISS